MNRIDFQTLALALCWGVHAQAAQRPQVTLLKWWSQDQGDSRQRKCHEGRCFGAHRQPI